MVDSTYARANFVPLTVSEEQLDKFRAMHPDANRSEIENTLENMVSQLRKLPLLELDDEFTKTEREALEFLKSGRLPKSIGGLIEGEEEVPYTKENPADRVDPFTGEPYSEQANRIGLQDGGVPEGAVRIYDEDQGLKPVMPLADVILGLGAFKFGKGAVNIGGEVLQKARMPKEVIHGSSVKDLKEIKAANTMVSKPNEGLQSAIYTSKRGGISADYGLKGKQYPIDTSDISSLKNLMSVDKNKVLNSKRPPEKFRISLDNAIKNTSSKKSSNI